MNTAHVDRSHRTPYKRAPYKEDRLAARLSSVLKKLFQKAASLEGTTLTEFVINSARQAAKRVIQEHEIITLSDRDRRVFMEALLNPPEPNQKLREAFDRNPPIQKSA